MYTSGDFSDQEYFQKEARQDERLFAVRGIAVAAREGRPPPSRVPVVAGGSGAPPREDFW